MVLGLRFVGGHGRVPDGHRGPRGLRLHHHELHRHLHLCRHPRLHPGGGQFHRADHAVHPGSRAHVHPHGGAVLSHGPCDPRLRRARFAVRQAPGPALLPDGGRRDHLLHPHRLLHGQYRHAGIVAGAGDAAAGLQLAHVHGPHPGHRRPGHDHSALGAGRAAGERGQHRRGPSADRGFPAGVRPGPALRGHAVPPDHHQPRGGAGL